jgi:pyridinium-3,5-biscarboxylic acid mononucleotide synthase
MGVEQSRGEREASAHVLEGVVAHEGEALQRLAPERGVAAESAVDVVHAPVDRIDLAGGMTERGDDVALLALTSQDGVLATQLANAKRQHEREQECDQGNERNRAEGYCELICSEVWHVGSSYTRDMRSQEVRDLLEEMRVGATTVDEALIRLRRLPSSDDLGFARVDTHRELRQGLPEAIYAEGKTPPEAVAIARRLLEHSTGPVLATRVPEETAAALLEAWPDAVHSARARVVVLRPRRATGNGVKKGTVVVVSAGTSDLPVSEEAALTAEAYGVDVERITDVGVAGLHRLLDVQDRLHAADVVIVVAGMEGALASLVGGITSAPVVAVPTSVGYGSSFEGLAALLAMLNSCAAGVAVFNIDNGFGAATFALRMLDKRS